MQTKLQSMVEAWTGTAVGFIVALILQEYVSWAYGLPLRLSDNLKITLLFTTVSVLRSYAVRRFFNKLHEK